MLEQKILTVSMSFLLDLTVLLGETLALNCSSLTFQGLLLSPSAVYLTLPRWWSNFYEQS